MRLSSPFGGDSRGGYARESPANPCHVDQRRQWEIEELIGQEERKGLLALRDGFNGGAP